MNTRTFFLTILTLLLGTTSVSAEDLCYDEKPSLEQSGQWDFSTLPRFDFYLPSKNIYGSFLTHAALHLQFQDKLWISFDHILPKNQVGLAYTIHRLRIEIGQPDSPSHFLFDQDFTQGCSGPGMSFFPGESHQLPAIEVPFLPPQNGPEVLPVKIQSWGRL